MAEITLYAVAEFDKTSREFRDGVLVENEDEASSWASRRDGYCTIKPVKMPVSTKRYSER